MAYTKIWQIHATVQKAVDYITDLRKTREDLISSYNCEPDSAGTEFAMTDLLASTVHPRRENETGHKNVLAHHFIQSFALDDKVTPERAHELGQEFAARLLKGKYEYVIATHIDKGYIHNHIIFNAASFYDLKKFECVPYRTAKDLRKISDEICIENGLSVIDAKNPGMSYWEWKQRKTGASWKAKVEKLVDSAIEQCEGYAQFKQILTDAGVEIKDGKDIRFKLDGMKYATVGRGAYSKYQIIERIKTNQKSFSSIIGGIAEQSSRYSLKQLADTLSLLDQEHISKLDDFTEKIEVLDAQISATIGKQKEIDLRNKQYKDVARCLITLRKCEEELRAGEKLRGKARASFDLQHELDHQAFSRAYKQLRAFGVNPDIDVEKVLGLIDEQTMQSKTMEVKIKELQKRRGKMQQACSMVETLQKSRAGSDETQISDEHISLKQTKAPGS